MQPKTVEIEIYDTKQKITTTIHVVQLSDNVFRTIENELFIDCLPLGTEFETRQGEDGKHEIVRITKESEFIARRFILTPQFKESDYRLLGDEVIKHGGFWQIDFGNIATINLPINCKLNLDEIFKIFGYTPKEIKV